MQSVSFMIWTGVSVSISYDDNHYTTCIIVEILDNSLLSPSSNGDDDDWFDLSTVSIHWRPFFEVPTVFRWEKQTVRHLLFGRINIKTLLCAHFFYLFLVKDVFFLYILPTFGSLYTDKRYAHTIFKQACSLIPLDQLINGEGVSMALWLQSWIMNSK